MLHIATKILVLALMGTLFAPPPKARRLSLPSLKELHRHAAESSLRRHAWGAEPRVEATPTTETPVELLEPRPPSPRVATRQIPRGLPQTPPAPSLPIPPATAPTHARLPLITLPRASSLASSEGDANPSIKPTHRQLAPDLRVETGARRRFTGFDLNPSLDDISEQSRENQAVIARYQARRERRLAREARRLRPIDADESDSGSDTEAAPMRRTSPTRTRGEQNPIGSRFADENPQ